MVRKAVAGEAEVLARLALEMWTDNTLGGLTDEFERLTLDDDAACFIKYVDRDPFSFADGNPAGYEDRIPVGFAQCGLRRDYVEGTDSSPVGYLEGIFVLDGYRKLGYARELLSACEQWAREKGCTEFASDCELCNEGSLHFHLAAGFDEANRIICFVKKL